MSLFSFLMDSARRYPNKPAVCHGPHRYLSYAELQRRALALGTALKKHGAPGARVLVASANCPEYPEILFGIWAAGMVAVPLNAKLHPREMEEIATDSEAVLALVSVELRDLALPFATTKLVIGSQAYEAACAMEPMPPADRKPDDLAWLFFTSGTTGRSKGAMLSHGNLVAMSVAHVADLETVEQDCSLIHAAPMSHGSGLYLLPYVMRGARQVIPESGGFDPGELLDLAAAHPRAGAFLAPTMVRRLRLHMAETGRGHALRSIVYGGGPMYVDELRRSIDAFGHILSQLYGQGESPMTITGLRAADHAGADDNILGSVGWPRSGIEVRVVDESGTPLPVGVVGEIACRGQTVMSGYWKNPSATEAALRDGWLFTGDMGSFDEAGFLTLRDRSKDVIISGGSNIYPREVEEALLSHTGVAEACVIGEKDDDWGETVTAVIVREPGSAVSVRDLDTHCLTRIARFKRPKRYVFTEQLPKSSYGKVLKREVTAQITGRGDMA
jgi:acyl-CoA synthetase (AMP-forming)/AMP-acid ligase II